MSIADTNGFVRSNSVQPRYPVNLRITIPFFPRRIFLTLIVGTEKREPVRLRAERKHHPVDTLGNLIAVTMALGILSIAALFAVLVASAL